MNDGDFSLNKPGNYTVELFEPNNFLNDKNSPADLAKFGKTYSVKMAGDAETYLWTTKTEPVEGKSYFGHIQETSGRMLRFKVDKLPDGNFSTGPSVQNTPADNKYQRDVTALSLDVYRVVANIRGLPENASDSAKFWEIVMDHTNELLDMIDKVRNGGSETAVSTPSVGPTQVPRGEATTSLGEQFRNRDKAVSYDDPPEEEG